MELESDVFLVGKGIRKYWQAFRDMPLQRLVEPAFEARRRA